MWDEAGRVGSRDGITAVISVFLIRSSTTLSPSTQGHSRKAADRKWGSRPHQTPTTLAPICRLPASRNLSTLSWVVFNMQPKLTQTPKLPLSEMGPAVTSSFLYCPQRQQALLLSNTPARTGRLLFVSERMPVADSRLFLPSS